MNWCGCRNWGNPLVHLVEAVTPPTTQRQYERRIAQVQRDVLRLEDRAVRDLDRFLSQLRAETVADLALIPTQGGWPAHRLNALLTEIDQARAQLAQRLTVALRDTTRAAWELGGTAQQVALGMPATGTLALSTDQLMVAQSLHADLVKRVSDDFRAKAAREITLTVAGAQTPQAAMHAIGGLLLTQQGRRAAGPIAGQSERLLRTEIMTVFNVADRIGAEQMARDNPGMRKWWDAPADSRTRPSHRAAEARYRPGGTEGPIPLNQDFMVGGERAQGPHDPRLSAAERVNCRCVRNLWHPSWGN